MEKVQGGKPSITAKTCPFLGNFPSLAAPEGIVNPKTADVGIAPTLFPCQADKCVMFDASAQNCKIVMGLDDLRKMASGAPAGK